MKLAAAGMLATSLFTATAAVAQPAHPGARGFVAFNLAVQEGPQRLSLAVPVVVFQSAGLLEIDDKIAGGTMLDFSGGIRGKRFGFGGGYSRTRVKDSHDLRASTNRMSSLSFQRVVNGVTPPLEHAENTIYLFAAATRAVSDRFDVMVSAGPSFFQVTQGVTTDIDVTDPYGAIRGIPTAVEKKTAIGFHAALDLTYMVAPQFGIGGLVRYAWGSIDLPNGSKSMTLGGLNVGAGARLRF